MTIDPHAYNVTTITDIKITNGVATIVRDVEGDKETVEVSLPVLVTAQQGLNDPRYPCYFYHQVFSLIH